MVQTPQVSSNPGLAPRQPSAGKALQGQTGNDETFSSLLTGKSGDGSATVADSITGSADAAQGTVVPQRGQSAGQGPQAKPGAGASSAEPSGTADAAQSTESQLLKSEYALLPGASSALFQLSLGAKSSPHDASSKRTPAATGDAQASPASVHAKAAKSGDSPGSAAACRPN